MEHWRAALCGPAAALQAACTRSALAWGGAGSRAEPAAAAPAPAPQVTGTEIPTPYAANLEALAFPQVADIVKMAREVVGR